MCALMYGHKRETKRIIFSSCMLPFHHPIQKCLVLGSVSIKHYNYVSRMVKNTTPIAIIKT